MVICNLNQIEASKLSQLGIYGSPNLTQALIEEFISGYTMAGKSPEELENIKEVYKRLGNVSQASVLRQDFIRQDCNSLFVDMKYQEKHLAWNDPSIYEDLYPPAGPLDYPTDYGSCCFLSAHANIHYDQGYTGGDVWSQLKAEAKQGQDNGLKLLLDIEQFNYVYSNGYGPGFMLSLISHLSKPMMQFSSNLFAPGTFNAIVPRPSLR